MHIKRLASRQTFSAGGWRIEVFLAPNEIAVLSADPPGNRVGPEYGRSP